MLVTRRRDIPGARYFGPYTDVGQLRRTLAIIRRLYTVRSCDDDLPARAPGAALPRLPHRPLPGAVRRLAERCRTTGAWWTTCWTSSKGGPRTCARGCARRCSPPASREDFERASELRDALRWLERLEEPASVEVIGTGDADVVGYARDGDDAVGVLIRVRDGAGGGPRAPVPRGPGGGGGRRGAERVPGPLLRAGRGSGAAAGDAVPAGRLGRAARAAAREPTGPSRSGAPRSAGSSWPTRTRGTCWRACGSSRSRPRSGRRIRCTRWDATWG